MKSSCGALILVPREIRQRFGAPLHKFQHFRLSSPIFRWRNPYKRFLIDGICTFHVQKRRGPAAAIKVLHGSNYFMPGMMSVAKNNSLHFCYGACHGQDTLVGLLVTRHQGGDGFAVKEEKRQKHEQGNESPEERNLID